MALDDLTDEVKKELEEWDEDDLDELAENITRYTEKVESLRKVMVNMDSRLEEVNQDLKVVKYSVKNLIDGIENGRDDSFLEDVEVGEQDNEDNGSDSDSPWL